MSMEQAARDAGAVDNGPPPEEAPEDVKDGYTRISVEFKQFLNEGDEIKGRLIGKTQVQMKGGRIGKYTVVREGDKQKVAFLGSVQLDELMNAVGVGSDIWVIFLRRERRSEDGFEMKMYNVFVKSIT